MFKFSLKVCLGSVALFFLLTPLSKAQALVIENLGERETYSITNDIEDNLIVLGGDEVFIEGDINGDLIVLSEEVDITGSVEGNVYIFSKEARIDNFIGKSLYVFAQEVEVKGEVVRDIFTFSERATLNGVIGEDLNSVGSFVWSNALVGDDLRVASQFVRISNSVGNDIIALVSGLHFTGTVGGNIFRAEDLFPSHRPPSWDSVSQGIRWTSSLSDLLIVNLWIKTFFVLFQSIGLVLVGILLFKFAPIRLEEAVSRMNNTGDFTKSAITGFMAYPVGFVLGFMLIISLFGWPLFQVLVLLAGLATVLVTPISGIWLGRKLLALFGSKRRYVVAVTLGVVLIQFVRIIPVFGWLFHQLLTFAVIGALLRAQWSKYKIAQNLSIKMSK